MAKWLFLASAVSLPASFAGLALYYLMVSPTRNNFFVGPAGAYTAVVLLLDALVAVTGLAAFVRLLWASSGQRFMICAIATISLITSVALHALAMQILESGFNSREPEASVGLSEIDHDHRKL
ncbi:MULTISPECIES: hypothetical protein [unclassified Cupriavidus]|uniref:hypothetical protein n=1 Tax=unclassified Cupriavidus TaxID=2640874 RepID=UPI001C0040A9|nr:MULTISPECIES: hypothetical protein [unclassified Cupriavidus]MCA3774588.1 hypothetical protein [Cutibacterium sp.]MCA3193345.1 hypothetical protein [Cupriavidus sp.]MCA3198147.1 hypothetical protein [Cupriavidus sp.]MCA3204914.1 hypothetical protein [Cupriavidus sp.]MCA3209599.1 hypothetical protein [Cupriavidus sp.]